MYTQLYRFKYSGLILITCAWLDSFKSSYLIQLMYIQLHGYKSLFLFNNNH